ncbi:MAG TPA: sulfate ABC transporter substrate-binding protein [Kineosporiaceae bacterium]
MGGTTRLFLIISTDQIDIVVSRSMAHREESVMDLNVMSRRRVFGLCGAVLAAAVGVAGCGGSGSTSGSGSSGSGAASATATATKLDIVGFSVIKSAYDALGAAFAGTPGGAGTTFKASYGASGAQSRAVIAGQKADVVAFSLQPDLDNVVKAGLVDPSWNAGPAKGVASRSVVVIAVRAGNPKGIKGWADLVRPGVGIVTADPGTSGSAKWNLLAAYGQALGATKDVAAAKTYLAGFVKNVVSWNESGRTATDAFVKGTGDVLISYENEAIAARAAGVGLDYVVPDTTVLIENPAAVTKSAPARAKDFLAFVESVDGQKILGSKGFRPVDDTVTISGVKGATDPANPFPKVANLITVDSLGGWKAVNALLFDTGKGLVPQLRA